MPAQSLSFPALRCGGLPTLLGPSRAAPFRCQQPHAAKGPAAQHFRTSSRRAAVAHALSAKSDGDKGEARPEPLPTEDTAAQAKAYAAFGPAGDGASGMLGGHDGVGGGGTGGAGNEDRRQQAAEAVAARLRQEVEPVTRALAGVQVWLQELANQQARLVKQHEQQEQEDQQQQQQQPAQDPSRRPSRFANGMSQDDVTRLRELPVAVALAVQQQMGRRDLVTGAIVGVAVVLGYGLGRREGNGPDAPATDTSRPTPTTISPGASGQPAGAVGEGTARSSAGSSGSSGSTGSSGSGSVAPGRVAGDAGWAGHVFVPPRAATPNEMELLKLCDRARPDVAAVRRLLAAGTAVNVSDRDGYSPLHRAVVWDNTELVGLLLAAGASPCGSDKDGYTPLHSARSRLAVEQLLGAGAPLEACTRWDNWTPLHARVAHGSVEAAEALIRAGADMSARESFGGTPLHVAAKKGQFEAVRLLLRCGAEVDAKDRVDHTPLVDAVRAEQLMTARLLLKAGADKKATALEYGVKSRAMSAILDAA